MPKKPASTFAEIVEEDLVRILGEYRQFVARAGSGQQLTHDERVDARRALRKLDLPLYCYRRDVVAWRAMTGAGDDRHRRELAVMYPHLFDAPLEWVRLRQAEKIRRRQVLAEIRRCLRRA